MKSWYGYPKISPTLPGSARAAVLWYVFICLMTGWVLSGCRPEVEPGIPTAADSPAPKPTPIILVYRSPAPSPTLVPDPTETPTPDAGANDPPDYYGGLVISLDNVGETLTMRPSGAFLLRLGEEFAWSVTVLPPDVITLNRNVALEPGEQGVFIARKRGSAILRAIGEPVCAEFDPPCTLPTVLFEMNVLVE